MILALLLAVAGAAGTLTLDADDPVIVVEVAGVPLRLRVDLDQRDVVELNPAAASRLKVTWHAGFTAVIGAVELAGREAPAVARIGGRKVPLHLSEHGRPCCAGVDGAISPALLPFAEVRWVRAKAAGPRHSWPLRRDESDGLTVGDGPLAVQLSLGRAETVASKAAGVLLAEGHGGRWAGSYESRAEAFGVSRPVRPFALATPATILGLQINRVLVRSDYGVGRSMPEERAQPGDIAVSRWGGGRSWPLVSLGRDLIGGCAEIVYRADPLSLELAC